ncbi:MAG TPA: tetraacyldisaccharide 4'-kinase [Geminicoccus sp.]|uniref:tetraacyldisaccharide 4'-kinase n=1 Tax=Geminicoccus sp. TaxID=2024832 RepID=UPI002CCC3172|nr:tetraacyldisaccharide 4'-kinase [Geminicoccus sp.]HWL69871.1 tetraacyldisaccharide 4'-kinase [Geminicoccus sp.]
MKPPAFWTDGGPLVSLLAPLGSLYGRIVTHRARRPGTRLDVPVLCIGNATLGGSGKTPVVRSLARILAEEFDLTPHVVTRGYGGRVRSTTRVDPASHDAAAVGDEPLLLARDAVVWVGRDRLASARTAVAAGARFILMDDGFQNAGLAKSASWLVVDGPAGIGNGRVFPAGPLRERFADAVLRAEALVMIGPDRQLLGAQAGLPVLAAELRHPPGALAELAGRPLLPFAGIGRPAKFFESLTAAGLHLVGTRAFPDHHPFTEAELAGLHDAAKRSGATLVTTEKDLVRLPPGQRRGIVTIPVTICWRNREMVRGLLRGLIAPVSTR